MFGNGKESTKELVILGLIGLGVYAQSNEINLANNTTMLLALFLIFAEHEEIGDVKQEICCIENLTNSQACQCGRHNGYAHYLERYNNGNGHRNCNCHEKSYCF